MWQFLLTAAIATSFTLLYSRLTRKSHDPPPPHDSSFRSPLSSFRLENGFEVETNEGNERRDAVSMFSSSASTLCETNKKKTGDFFSRKSGIPCRRLKYRCNGGNYGSLTERQKRRRFFASSKDWSMLNWELGVGIMYLMSAGNAEIKKLSSAMDETSKVVQELRAEIYRRKIGQVDSSAKGVHNDEVVGNGDARFVHDVDCPSSVLTDEQEARVAEMDQLEAELESELLKLRWPGAEDCDNEVLRWNVTKDNVLCERLHEEQDKEASIFYRCRGVAPSELDNKLCHLLIEQQGTQIVELESELNSAQSKLREKEIELQALKDRVRRLTEFALSTTSDDEINVKEGQEGTCRDWENSCKTESDSRKSVVGMKI